MKKKKVVKYSTYICRRHGTHMIEIWRKGKYDGEYCRKCDKESRE